MFNDFLNASLHIFSGILQPKKLVLKTMDNSDPASVTFTAATNGETYDHPQTMVSLANAELKSLVIARNGNTLKSLQFDLVGDTTHMKVQYKKSAGTLIISYVIIYSDIAKTFETNTHIYRA